MKTSQGGTSSFINTFSFCSYDIYGTKYEIKNK